ncbi:MerR family transcriptional regulator [Nonomuraea sp. MG754425]|uniref:MerR family transcriptional regulator n=1 Tax=Nonomuraea sp. MG754425 TaxID=2570319 RepID=UPI001EFFF202|nr:MerR family transcriptional regulator [Nonomuraea sp. MG754425]MCF6471763.1 MerR family transcriptional regulator [Nonomuraea sp. MG754425]
MRIGELAERTGVDQQLLRYYEKQGLLEPERAANGYREYADRDIVVVRRIRALLAAGLSTAAIAELGTCVRDEPPTPACAKALQQLRDERGRVDRLIGRLLASRAALDAVIERGDDHPHPRSAATRATGRPPTGHAQDQLGAHP